MLLKIILSLIVFSQAYSARSISCPSVEDVNNGMFHNWLPLYVDGEELASQVDTLQFIREVKAFRVARWDVRYLEYGHCFYEGGLMTSKIILAHDSWRPVASPFWSWINPKLAECLVSPQQCAFLE